MEEKNTAELVRLARAVKAFARSVEQAYVTRTFEGTGKMMVKSYNGLHRKAAQLLPDDYYITEGLVLDIEEGTPEEEMIAQVRLAVSQLRSYLQDLTRSERIGFEEGDWHTLGRDLQDQILNMTKNTIRRAVKNIDLRFMSDSEVNDEDEAPEDQKGKRRIRVKVMHDDIPEPPEPPEPPRPPFR